MQIESGGTVIHVDPRGDYTNAKPADLILITDTPVDHLAPDLIQQLRKPGAPVVLTETPSEWGARPSFIASFDMGRFLSWFLLQRRSW